MKLNFLTRLKWKFFMKNEKLICEKIENSSFVWPFPTFLPLSTLMHMMIFWLCQIKMFTNVNRPLAITQNIKRNIEILIIGQIIWKWLPYFCLSWSLLNGLFRNENNSKLWNVKNKSLKFKIKSKVYWNFSIFHHFIDIFMDIGKHLVQLQF